MSIGLIKQPIFQTLAISSLIIIGLLIHLGSSVITQDILVYRQAGVQLVQGHNPYQLPPISDYYDFSQYKTGLYDEAHPNLQIWVSPFSLFVPIFLSLMPSSLLPALNFVLLVLGQWLSWLVARHFVPKAASRRSAIQHCVMYLVLISPALIDYIGWGSINSFETIPWLIFLLAFVNGKDAIAGVSLGFCSFKPQLVFLPILILAWRGHQFLSRQLIVPLLLTSLILSGMSFLYYPNLFFAYRHLDRTILEYHSRYSITLPALLAPGLLKIAVPLSFCLFSSVLFFLRTKPVVASRSGIVRAMLVLLLPGLICFPYLWLHDYLISSPCFVIASSAFVSRNSTNLKLLIATLILAVYVTCTKCFSLGLDYYVSVAAWLTLSCLVTMLCHRRMKLEI